MKVCPKCSAQYPDMWNICEACKVSLKKEGLLRKVFAKPRPCQVSTLSLLENVIEQSDIVFLYIDKDKRPMIGNQAVEDILGYGREELFRDDWLDLLFKDKAARKLMFKAFLDSCLRSIKSRVYECSVMKKGGGECILSWRNAAVTDSSGDISGIICTAFDITEEKSSEDDVAIHSERLRNIFASIKDYALLTTNLEGKITYYGKGTAELFGWKQDMTLNDIDLIFPDEVRQKTAERLKKSIEEYGKFEGEAILSRNSQGNFPAELTVTGLLDTRGERVGYIYVSRDITRRKELEEQMVQSEKLAAIGQLAAGVAHEINNPLLVISGRLEMLTMKNDDFPDDIKRTLDTIKGQTERMRIIVDRLLSYSRRKTPHMDAVDVNEILKTVSPLLAYHPEFKGITWKEEHGKDLPKIHGDFNQLQELFLNIGLNACQAMQKKGALAIVSEEKKDGFVEVRIKDTGPGIKKEDMEKIFNPFFTTKDSGTGLGLAICNSIMNAHGGKMDVVSELGKGTTFKLSFPVKKE